LVRAVGARRIRERRGADLARSLAQLSVGLRFPVWFPL
jgi:hypothetical protein